MENYEKNICEKIYEKLCELEEKINEINRKINENKKNGSIKEIKIEKYVLDEKFIKNCLEYCSVDNDIQIIKKIYFEDIREELYPIRINKNKLEYFNENKWIQNPKELSNILSKNIQILYASVNIFSNYEDDIDTFMKNQNYILGLSEEKYKDKLLKNLKLILN
jgi:hypothetical protein